MIQHHPDLRGVSAVLDDVDQHAPDSAQDIFRQISEACYFVAHEITRRSSNRLPGLQEAFSDRGMVSVGGHSKGPLGTYQWDKWKIEERLYDEIHVNVGHLIYSDSPIRFRAERITTTIGHELAHLYAEANSIRDTSGRGNRYHNRRFAEIAVQLGLRVERSERSYIGFTTPGLSPQGKDDFADLVLRVVDTLRMNPTTSVPSPVTQSGIVATPTVEVVTQGKYVFARCGCRDGRGRRKTVRIAHGWWQAGSIGCSICREVFVESPPHGTNDSTKGTSS